MAAQGPQTIARKRVSLQKEQELPPMPAPAEPPSDAELDDASDPDDKKAWGWVQAQLLWKLKNMKKHMHIYIYKYVGMHPSMNNTHPQRSIAFQTSAE